MSKFFDSLVGKDFVGMLNYCMSHSNLVPDYELEFLYNMKELYSAHLDAEALGLPAWEPSVKQINFLKNIRGML